MGTVATILPRKPAASEPQFEPRPEMRAPADIEAAIRRAQRRHGDPTLRDTPGVTPAFMSGVLGDCVLVNGAPWPVLEVTNTETKGDGFALGDGRPGRLEQVAVRHAARAGGLAGAAVEAQRQVVHGGVREPDAAFREGLDEEDATAWRVHLRAELGEGRTGGQAQAAMHARIDAFHGETVQRERLRRRRGGSVAHAQIPATKRPGLKRCPGSSWRRLRCRRRAPARASRPGWRSESSRG